MDFFSPLENTKPYVKAAFEGFAGSGKTLTAALLAIGLHRRIESTKPVILFDTERASKFLKPLLEAAGIKALVKESRSLADLKEAMRRCRDGATDILLIDSISHVYENFVEAYKRRVKRTRLEFNDWGLIKPTWKAEFSDPFVCDPYHCVFTGRAAYEYENEKNQETGKREIYKSGIKMKVEAETAYEPDLLFLMERFEEVLTEKKNVWREATVLKDRSTLIDGKTFKNPTYDDFAPAIEYVLANPKNAPSRAERDAGVLVATEEDKREWARRRAILLETIEATLVKAWAGRDKASIKAKTEALEAAYGTPSWTKISTQLSLDTLQAGLRTLETLAGAVPAAPANGADQEPLPEWCADAKPSGEAT